MKTIVTVCLLLAITRLISCSEDAPKPKQQSDPFIGYWELYGWSDGYEISFNVEKNGDEYIFSNITINHPEIPNGTTLINHSIEVSNKFADGNGFGRIQISGSNDTFWIIISLTNNEIYQAGAAYTAMYTYLMETNIINKPNMYTNKHVEFRKVE